VFEPYGLKVVSQTLAVISITSLVAMPLYKVGKFFYVPGRLNQVKRKNVNITLSILAVAALLSRSARCPTGCCAPWSSSRRTPRRSMREVPGILEEIDVKPGQKVAVGEKLGKLVNLDLAYDIRGDRIADQKNEVRIQTLKRPSFSLKDRGARARAAGK